MKYSSVNIIDYQYLMMCSSSSGMPKFKVKLDVREAYWHVKLYEESSKLTTMITPFGRYRWKRLSFELKVSSQIFQRKLDEVLGGPEGVFSVDEDVSS